MATTKRALLKKGDKVLIRTVTHYQAGEVDCVVDGFVRLTKASWIADTGRFAQAVATGEFSEVEPFAAPVMVNLAAVIDITYLPKLPAAQK